MVPWICQAFDSHQNSRGNSGAFLPGYSGVLTGYSPGFEVS